MPNPLNHARRMSRLTAFAAITLAALSWAAPSQASPYPVPLYDLRLPRPVLAISSLNSSGRLLAVEVEPDTKRPLRVLSIDKRGRVGCIDELGEVREITVPEERLWITGEGEASPAQSGVSGTSRPMPVTGVEVYLSGGGESYTVAYKTRGGYYELRHKDRNGRLLFIASPKDGYSLKTVQPSYDGSRILVVDESDLTVEGGVNFGQRLYFYDTDGRLTADLEMGGELDDWLDTSGGFMAADGSYYAAVRGMGLRPGKSVAFFNGDGTLKWEKSYFQTHTLTDDFGGTIGVKGGSPSLLSYISKDGSLKAIERTGYGFDFWLSGDGAYAYIKVFKPFDVEKSGVPGEIKTVFPGAKVVTLDLAGLLPEEGKRQALVVAPDGKAFIHSFVLSMGQQEATNLTYYDTALKELWDERFFNGSVTPQFVDKSRGFVLKFGSPATRLIYYEVK
jgi:hypothetical protein